MAKRMLDHKAPRPRPLSLASPLCRYISELKCPPPDFGREAVAALGGFGWMAVARYARPVEAWIRWTIVAADSDSKPVRNEMDGAPARSNET